MASRTMTGEQLATHIGTSKSVISKLSTGKQRYNQVWLELIAYHLQCDVPELFSAPLPKEHESVWQEAELSVIEKGKIENKPQQKGKKVEEIYDALSALKESIDKQNELQQEANAILRNLIGTLEESAQATTDLRELLEKRNSGHPDSIQRR